MDLTNGLEAIKKLLSCVQADGSQVSHVIVEEKDIKAKSLLFFANVTLCFILILKMLNDVV
jgi:hypothetical protein